MKVLYFVIYLSITSILFAQQEAPLKNDFKLSEENIPSTTVQTNPKVFYNENNEFLSVWEDYRTGVLSYYAQRFDLLGNKIGSNFKVFGYDKVLFDDKTVLAVHVSSYDYYFMDYGTVVVEAKLSDSTIFKDPPILLGSGITPWCATGWLGINYDIIFSNNKYVVFFNNNGSLTKKTLSSTGSLIEEVDLNKLSVLLAKAGSLANGDHAVLWSPSAEWGPSDIPLGIYGTFFNSNDQVTADSVLLYHFPDEMVHYGSYGFQDRLYLRTVSDSLYQVFFMGDSLKLISFKFNKTGNLIGEITKHSIPSIDLSGLNVYKNTFNYYLTNINNGLFDLFVTIQTDNFSTQKCNSTIFTFDRDGNYLSSTSDTTFSTRLNSTLIKTGENNYLYATSEGKDVYLSRLQNFQTTDLLKLNDDISGSNENNSKLIPRDGNSLLSVWRDEESIKGKIIGSDGTILSEQKVLAYEPSFFFSNGKSIALEKQKIDYQFFNLEFTLFDENFNIVRKTMFETNEHAIDVIYNYFPFLTQNDNLLVLYAIKGEIRAKLLDKELIEIKDILLNQDSTDYHSLKIFKDGNDKIILHWDNNLQKYDLALNALGTKHLLRADEYLGNDKFLNFLVTSYSSVSLHYGRIFDINDTTIINNLFFGSYITDLSILSIDENHFVAFCNNYDKFYMQVYTSSGVMQNSRFEIADLAGVSPTSFDYKICNGNIIFTWSDVRNGNYDVFAKVYKLSSITDVGDENPTPVFDYNLAQNYPNPFNPNTTINYQLPTTCLVTLKIYDVLGKEVAVLVNEEKQVGSYKINFSGSDLASGIYFYTLRANNFVQNRKMVLLK